MKFNFSQKQPHAAKCCEFLHAGRQPLSGAPFPGTLLRAYAQRAPSAADLVASMRAKFKTPLPWKRKSSPTMSLCSPAPAEA